MFNCSEQLTASMLIRYLFGMIRSGSWACFENVDCVEPGILSILGEHLSIIRIAMKSLEKFVLSQYTARGLSKTDSQKVCFVRSWFLTVADVSVLSTRSLLEKISHFKL